MKVLAVSILFLFGLVSLAESYYGAARDRRAPHYHGWAAPSNNGWSSNGWSSNNGNNGWSTPGWASPAAPSTKPTTKPVATTAKPAVAARTLAQLHHACLKEGGRVIVYAGGDTAGQLDGTKAAFEAKFNGTTLDMIVDFSKFHNARIDLQLTKKMLIPDVVQLQTLQDFPRWKKEGVLMQFKPLGFEAVYDEFKDPEGYYTAIFASPFTGIVSKILMPDNKTWPVEATDYLKPEFKDKLMITWPNDDDATLFWYYQIVQKYGWDYIEKLKAQNPVLVRGTQEPFDAADQGRTYASPSGSGGMSNAPYYNAIMVLPKKDPFMMWPQTAAIFKNASRPDCAQLYMTYLLDYNTTTTEPMDVWSPRRDAPFPINLLTGERYKSPFDYKGQTDVLAFGRFMADRAEVERFKTEIFFYFGEPQGPPSPGYPGMYPEKALPH